MDVEKWESEFKKGFSKPFALLSLANSPNYPYGIIKAIKNVTENKFEIAGSNIYPLLSQMEKDGLIAEEIEDLGQEKSRKTYRLTSSGEEFLALLKDAMINFTKIIQTMLDIAD